MLKESDVVWEGQAMFVTHTPGMADVLGPYAVCVTGPTAAVVVGRTANRSQAIRCAQRMDRYPDNARKHAGL